MAVTVQQLNLATPDSGAGDALRDGGIKINNNFTALATLANKNEADIAAIGPHTNIAAVTAQATAAQNTANATAALIPPLTLRVSNNEAAIAALPPPVDLTALTIRVDKNETDIAAIGPHTDITALTARVDKNETDIAALPPPTDIAPLTLKVNNNETAIANNTAGLAAAVAAAVLNKADDDALDLRVTGNEIFKAGTALEDTGLLPAIPGTLPIGNLAEDDALFTALLKLQNLIDTKKVVGVYVGPSASLYANLPSAVDQQNNFTVLIKDDIGTGTESYPQYPQGLYISDNVKWDLLDSYEDFRYLSDAQVQDRIDDLYGTVSGRSLFAREQALKGTTLNFDSANTDYQVAKTWDGETLNKRFKSVEDVVWHTAITDQALIGKINIYPEDSNLSDHIPPTHVKDSSYGVITGDQATGELNSDERNYFSNGIDGVGGLWLRTVDKTSQILKDITLTNVWSAGTNAGSRVNIEFIDVDGNAYPPTDWSITYASLNFVDAQYNGFIGLGRNRPANPAIFKYIGTNPNGISRINITPLNGGQTSNTANIHFEGANFKETITGNTDNSVLWTTFQTPEVTDQGSPIMENTEYVAGSIVSFLEPDNTDPYYGELFNWQVLDGQTILDTELNDATSEAELLALKPKLKRFSIGSNVDPIKTLIVDFIQEDGAAVQSTGVPDQSFLYVGAGATLDTVYKFDGLGNNPAELENEPRSQYADGATLYVISTDTSYRYNKTTQKFSVIAGNKLIWQPTSDGLNVSIGDKIVQNDGHTINIQIPTENGEILIAPANGDWSELNYTWNEPAGWTIGAGQSGLSAGSDTIRLIADTVSKNFLVAVGGGSYANAILPFATLADRPAANSVNSGSVISVVEDIDNANNTLFVAIGPLGAPATSWKRINAT